MLPAFLLILGCILVIVDFMNEKFFAEVYKLAVDDPSIDLMKEYSVTAEENLCEHCFNHWVARYAPS